MTGSQELWSTIILHLRTFLEHFGTINHATTTPSSSTITDGGLGSLMADEICRIVTDALIKTAGTYFTNRTSTTIPTLTNITQS